MLATKLAESISQQVVIDNRGGAHGIIATELTAKAPPDGYTIFMAGTGHAINPYMYKKLPYDSVKGFRAGESRRRGAEHTRAASVGARGVDPRTDRSRQGEARILELRFSGRRRQHPSGEQNS